MSARVVLPTGRWGRSPHPTFFIGILLACLLSVERTGSGQNYFGPLDWSNNKDEAKMQAWYNNRDQLWNVLTRDAGKPRNGVALEIRQVDSENRDSEATDLVVWVKNVSSRPVRVGGCKSWPYTDVLVRDSGGKSVRLTDDGINYFSWQRVDTIIATLELKPGYAWGFVVPLRKYFKLADRGAYTVLARNHYDGDVKGELVSNAVTLKIGQGLAVGVDLRAFQPTVASSTNVTNAGSSDKEWTSLISKAGQLHRGCVLDAMMSPEEPTNLVASLTCLRVSGSAPYGSEWKPGEGRWGFGESSDGRADAGRQPADYHVAVLGPDGTPVTMTPFGRQAVAAVVAERCSRLTEYSAIGAVIPLAKWFDLRNRGDYTVLVTLKAPDEKHRNWVRVRPGYPAPPRADEEGPLWVAKPIKFRVPIARK